MPIENGHERIISLVIVTTFIFKVIAEEHPIQMDGHKYPVNFFAIEALRIFNKNGIINRLPVITFLGNILWVTVCQGNTWFFQVFYRYFSGIASGK